jgi:hypothetical protein
VEALLNFLLLAIQHPFLPALCNLPRSIRLKTTMKPSSLSESNFSTFCLFALTVPRLVVVLSLDELEDPAGHTRLS